MGYSDSHNLISNHPDSLRLKVNGGPALAAMAQSSKRVHRCRWLAGFCDGFASRTMLVCPNEGRRVRRPSKADRTRGIQPIPGALGLAHSYVALLLSHLVSQGICRQREQSLGCRDSFTQQFSGGTALPVL